MSLSTFLNGRSAIRLRSLMWLSLSDIGRVLTATATSDSGGGASTSWVPGADVPCRVDPIGGQGNESIVAGRLSDRSTHLITVPPGTGLSTVNRFAVTNRGTFEITAVRTRTAEWAKTFEAVAS